MRQFVGGLCLILALSPLVACSKGAQAPAASAPTAAPAAASGFGVPECDDYVTKYLACIDQKVPAGVRDQVRAAFEQTKSSWQQAATSEAGRSTLAMACQQATEAARMSMGAYGCTF